MTKDLMQLMGIEEDEFCPECGNRIEVSEPNESGLCQTCIEYDIFCDSLGENEDDY